MPTRARKIINLDYSIFANKIDLNDQNFANDITNSLMLGDIYILKGAFNKEFFDSLKNKCFDYFKNEPSSFHKMLEGCPDFHRIIDLDVGKKYSFKWSCFRKQRNRNYIQCHWRKRSKMQRL